MGKQKKSSKDSPVPERQEKVPPSKPSGRKDNTQPRAYPDIVDDTLDDSFPASDPPAWAGK